MLSTGFLPHTNKEYAKDFIDYVYNYFNVYDGSIECHSNITMNDVGGKMRVPSEAGTNKLANPT